MGKQGPSETNHVLEDNLGFYEIMKIIFIMYFIMFSQSTTLLPFQPLPFISFHCQPFQPFRALSSHFWPFTAISSHLQPFSNTCCHSSHKYTSTCIHKYTRTQVNKCNSTQVTGTQIHRKRCTQVNKSTST